VCFGGGYDGKMYWEIMEVMDIFCNFVPEKDLNINILGLI